MLDFTVHLGRIKWGAGVLLEATNNACPVRLLTQIKKKDVPLSMLACFK